jgi:hypothetical protein
MPRKVRFWSLYPRFFVDSATQLGFEAIPPFKVRDPDGFMNKLFTTHVVQMVAGYYGKRSSMYSSWLKKG